ncbi:MAG: YggS family pyridoxal phosphate-dependent enzyme [Proteobacteria bacterium]|nr:YggS family pyridoxal phosphate-dependent enzyme [Pseudomonadota bacterium]
MVPQNSLQHVRDIRNRIESAARAAGRSVDSVTLLAVSKGHSANSIRQVAEAGVRDIGESYFQEALGKIEELREVSQNPGLTWHFIGRLQANKTKVIASHFDWVHGIERLKIAERLSEQRPFHAPPLNVCLQVNIGGEASKGGVTVTELPALAAAVAVLPRLKLRGLMCIPPDEDDPARQRMWFAAMRRALEELNSGGAGLDTLSMGMSGDFEAAIAEGATIVRIGTALFGERPRATNTAPPQ